MNKFYYALSLLLFLSCSNESYTEIDEVDPSAAHKVQFKVNHFKQEVVPMTKIGQTSDSQFIENGFLYIYNSTTGALVAKVENNEFDDPIELALAKGDYSAVAIAFNASSENQEIESSTLNSGNLYTYNNKTIDRYNNGASSERYSFKNHYNNDYFYARHEFSVSTDDIIDIEAKRASGRLELHIMDIVKADSYSAENFAYVKVTLENFTYGINFNDGSSVEPGDIKYIYLTRKEWDAFKDRPMVINAMPSANPKVTFEFSDSYLIPNSDFNNPTTSYTKVIEGFNIYENKLTRLKGNIFTSAPNFQIEIDTDWEAIEDLEF